tara:strand:- start:4095 stop:4583 length:489 start_codon:yes stop_codon:yes gene_type:complete
LKTRLPSICIECGLCCDGTLYSDVVFSRDKDDPRIEKEKQRFEKLEYKKAPHDRESPAWRIPLTPCQFLGTEKENCCGIYEDRPDICSSHDCWLLLEYNAGFKTYGFAVNEINRIKALQDELRIKGLTQAEIGSQIRRMGELDAFYGTREKYDYMEKRLKKG